MGSLNGARKETDVLDMNTGLRDTEAHLYLLEIPQHFCPADDILSRVLA